MKKIRYLTIEEVDWAHSRILESTGGERGDLARANLEFVLERVKDIGEGLNMDEAIVKKAAFLFYSLVVRHPFINGNKRTAVEVAESFLELNGYHLRPGTEEAYRFLADTGSGKTSLSKVEDWIGTNLASKSRRPRRDK